jgi:outer membrane immunogenic protein
MHKQLLTSAAALALSAGVAFASDLPTHKAPPPPPPPVFSWTGFYIGGEIGYGWGEESDDLRAITGYPLDSFGVSGAIGGIKAGYNQQINALVLGVEADIEASGIQGSKGGTFTHEGTGVGSLSMHNTWQSSLRARAGVAFDRLLVYGTGGLAIADDRESFYVNDPFYSAPWAGSQTNTLYGWTIGAGIEYAIDNHWSLSGEVRYADFGKASYSIPAGMSLSGTTTSYSAGFSETLAQVGVGYRF